MPWDGWNSLNPPVFAVIEKGADPAALLVPHWSCRGADPTAPLLQTSGWDGQSYWVVRGSGIEVCAGQAVHGEI